LHGSDRLINVGEITVPRVLEISEVSSHHELRGYERGRAGIGVGNSHSHSDFAGFKIRKERREEKQEEREAACDQVPFLVRWKCE
jgi:hypothetical protein